VRYSRDAILKFLSSTPKGLYDSDKRNAYETIDRYLREYPDDAEVRNLLLKHALETPLTAGGGTAMLSAALAHHPDSDARDRLLERALKSKHREILEWGAQALGALNPQERNPQLVKLLAHRADEANAPFVDAFMRNTLAPDDYKAFRLVAEGLASRSHRGRVPQDQLWQAMLRLEQLWGSSIHLPHLAHALDRYIDERVRDNSVLVRRAAARHWNASGRDLLRAIADTNRAQLRAWGLKEFERFDLWRHAVVGVAMDDADAAFDHLVHDVLADQGRFQKLFNTGDLKTNAQQLIELLCVPLSVASPAQLERMRDDIHAFAARLPEWIPNAPELARRFLSPRAFKPWHSAPDALAWNAMYALRPLVRAVFHALEEKHGATLRKDYDYKNLLFYTAKGLLLTLLVDRADDIPQANQMLDVMDDKDFIETGNEARAVEVARTLLETAFAWDDSNAAEWNKRVRASDELQAFLELTTPITHALWKIAMAGMPGATDRESEYDSVLNRLFPPNASFEQVDRNLREILELLKPLPRNRWNPEREVMRFTRAVRERFAPAVYDEFIRGLHGDSWNNNQDFLGNLIGVLHGATESGQFIPLLIMPNELLTANPQVVNAKLRALQATRLWELESALRRKFCS
jgi:hypothetical protein